jgi:hypothetical protein
VPARKDLIVESLEVLALLLFAAAVAGALWAIYWPGGLCAAAGVIAAGAWLMDRPPKQPRDSSQ